MASFPLTAQNAEKTPKTIVFGAKLESGDAIISRAVASQVPSARGGLTSVFGMGTGGTLQPLSPEIVVLPHSENYTGTQFDPAISLCFPFPSASLRLPSASASFFRFFFRSSPRPISISKLPHYCAFTADLSTLSSSRGLTSLRYGSLFLEVGFTLRCLQRLSHPYFASLLCRWHDNSCTSGTSIPVLSY